LVEVSVKKGEELERALRRFKKKYEKAGILREVRRKSFYLKPSAEKKLRKAKPRR
jgi:small subunit ribosomal protein S21|tara:strand:+ start:1891 stop:2055 length:165 start_codon:yes stop_codon:yes gene_type:complete